MKFPTFTAILALTTAIAALPVSDSAASVKTRGADAFTGAASGEITKRCCNRAEAAICLFSGALFCYSHPDCGYTQDCCRC